MTKLAESGGKVPDTRRKRNFTAQMFFGRFDGPAGAIPARLAAELMHNLMHLSI